MFRNQREKSFFHEHVHVFSLFRLPVFIISFLFLCLRSTVVFRSRLWIFVKSTVALCSCTPGKASLAASLTSFHLG